jgi:cytochrome b subunit of formate dehydrogenase
VLIKRTERQTRRGNFAATVGNQAARSFDRRAFLRNSALVAGGLATIGALPLVTVVLGGAAVAITGYVLMFPFYGTTIGTMQYAQMIHAVVAMLFVAAMLGHIYIGTIGMEGAFEAMGEGTVDVNWAKEHHSLWLEDDMSRISPNKGHQRPVVTPAE